MEEDEYKATYREIAKIRCVFEKALANNQCKCRLSQRFQLADREGYTCKSEESAGKCGYLLKKLQESSRFLLKSHAVGAPLPHNADIRVQVGGLRGLRAALGHTENEAVIADVRGLIEQTEQQYDTMDMLPYSRIVQSIAGFQGRKRSKSK